MADKTLFIFTFLDLKFFNFLNTWFRFIHFILFYGYKAGMCAVCACRCAGN